MDGRIVIRRITQKENVLIQVAGRCKIYHTVFVAQGTIRTTHMTYAAALKTTTHPKTWCRKPYAATQHLMLLMMGMCTRNMSS